jgi:hypothetical protein
MDKLYFSDKNIEKQLNKLISICNIKNSPESTFKCKKMLISSMKLVFEKYGNRKPNNIHASEYFEKLNKKSIINCNNTIKSRYNKKKVINKLGDYERQRDTEMYGNRQLVVESRPQSVTVNSKHNGFKQTDDKLFKGIDESSHAGAMAPIVKNSSEQGYLSATGEFKKGVLDINQKDDDDDYTKNNFNNQTSNANGYKSELEKQYAERSSIYAQKAPNMNLTNTNNNNNNNNTNNNQHVDINNILGMKKQETDNELAGFDFYEMDNLQNFNELDIPNPENGKTYSSFDLITNDPNNNQNNKDFLSEQDVNIKMKNMLNERTSIDKDTTNTSKNVKFDPMVSPFQNNTQQINNKTTLPTSHNNQQQIHQHNNQQQIHQQNNQQHYQQNNQQHYQQNNQQQIHQNNQPHNQQNNQPQFSQNNQLQFSQNNKSQFSQNTKHILHQQIQQPLHQQIYQQTKTSPIIYNPNQQNNTRLIQHQHHQYPQHQHHHQQHQQQQHQIHKSQHILNSQHQTRYTQPQQNTSQHYNNSQNQQHPQQNNSINKLNLNIKQLLMENDSNLSNNSIYGKIVKPLPDNISTLNEPKNNDAIKKNNSWKFPLNFQEITQLKSEQLNDMIEQIKEKDVTDLNYENNMQKKQMLDTLLKATQMKNEINNTPILNKNSENNIIHKTSKIQSIIYIKSENHTDSANYNNYKMNLNDIYKNINEIELFNYNIPYNTDNITNFSYKILIKYKNEINEFDLNPGKYTINELFELLQDGFDDSDLHLTIFKDSDNLIHIKNTKNETFDILSSDECVNALFGFNKLNYNDSTEYISENPYNLNPNNYIYLFFSNINKEPFAKINLQKSQTHSFVKSFSTPIKELNNINIQFKTFNHITNNFIPYDFSYKPHKLDIKIHNYA